MTRSAGICQLDPGSDTGSIHAHASDDAASPTCDNSALIGSRAIHAVADRVAPKVSQ